ncbi:hypothetical protein HNR67_004436 [Crossiella cryophila]|uniref:Uncharacterized protein n=1 Tax=Crossiella cryophila TaxID=43355 RepID=A0A7W7CEG6_9PSEU|nr:hypothetical protein [Crossiella cryophila]
MLYGSLAVLVRRVGVGRDPEAVRNGQHGVQERPTRRVGGVGFNPPRVLAVVVPCVGRFGTVCWPLRDGSLAVVVRPQAGGWVGVGGKPPRRGFSCVLRTAWSLLTAPRGAAPATQTAARPTQRDGGRSSGCGWLAEGRAENTRALGATLEPAPAAQTPPRNLLIPGFDLPSPLRWSARPARPSFPLLIFALLASVAEVHERRSRASSPDGQESKDGGESQRRRARAVLVRFPHPRQPSDTKPHPGKRPPSRWAVLAAAGCSGRLPGCGVSSPG